jgi:hypothetical protein
LPAPFASVRIVIHGELLPLSDHDLVDLLKRVSTGGVKPINDVWPSFERVPLAEKARDFDANERHQMCGIVGFQKLADSFPIQADTACLLVATDTGGDLSAITVKSDASDPTVLAH